MSSKKLKQEQRTTAKAPASRGFKWAAPALLRHVWGFLDLFEVTQRVPSVCKPYRDAHLDLLAQARVYTVGSFRGGLHNKQRPLKAWEVARLGQLVVHSGVRRLVLKNTVLTQQGVPPLGLEQVDVYRTGLESRHWLDCNTEASNQLLLLHHAKRVCEHVLTQKLKHELDAKVPQIEHCVVGIEAAQPACIECGAPLVVVSTVEQGPLPSSCPPCRCVRCREEERGFAATRQLQLVVVVEYDHDAPWGHDRVAATLVLEALELLRSRHRRAAPYDERDPFATGAAFDRLFLEGACGAWYPALRDRLQLPARRRSHKDAIAQEAARLAGDGCEARDAHCFVLPLAGAFVPAQLVALAEAFEGRWCGREPHDAEWQVAAGVQQSGDRLYIFANL